MSDGHAPIALVRRAATAFGLAAVGVPLLNAWLRLVLCVDGQALGLICAMAVWATTAAASPTQSSLRRSHPRKAALVNRRWLAASGITFLLFLLLDVLLRFRFLLLSIALLLALVHVLGAIATLLGRAGAQLRRPGPEIRALGFVLALAGSAFVAVTKLSALGAYRLVSHERGGAYELTRSTRAEIGAEGFRGAVPARARRPGVARVAILGDSATYGWLVSAGDAYPAILERELARRLSGGVEVLNAGVPAYDLPRMLERLQRHVAAYRPDVIVLLTGVNDRDPTGPSYQARLDAFVDAGRAIGARVVLATYPNRDPDEDQLARERDVRAVAIRRRLRCVDLAQLGRRIPGSFFLFEGHPSASGHRAMATELAATIASLLTAVDPSPTRADPGTPAPG